MANREFTPLEYHSNVSSLSFDGEGGYDEQGTTNREIVAKHLDIDTFIYVLSSSIYEHKGICREESWGNHHGADNV